MSARADRRRCGPGNVAKPALRESRVWPWIAALALLSTAGCAKRGTEDVRARVEGSHLVIENRSGTDVHVQLVSGPAAWVPLSTDLNLLADGAKRTMRIAPSERGQSVEVAWWRPGAKVAGTDVRAPDRIRRLPVELVPLSEPLSQDEALVRVCIQLAEVSGQEEAERPGGGRQPARSSNPHQVERSCMKQAEDGCPTGNCGPQLAEQRAALARVQDALAKHREAAAAPRPGELEAAAKQAFQFLRNGPIEGYVATLCPSLREGYAGPFMQKSLRERGEDFARRQVGLGRVSDQGPLHVTFEAFDVEMMTGHKPPNPALKIMAKFGRESHRSCLLDVTELR